MRYARTIAVLMVAAVSLCGAAQARDVNAGENVFNPSVVFASNLMPSGIRITVGLPKSDRVFDSGKDVRLLLVTENCSDCQVRIGIRGPDLDYRTEVVDESGSEPPLTKAGRNLRDSGDSGLCTAAVLDPGDRYVSVLDLDGLYDLSYGGLYRIDVSRTFGYPDLQGELIVPPFWIAVGADKDALERLKARIASPSAASGAISVVGDGDKVASVLAGCRSAAASIRSGQGIVRVYDRATNNEGGCTETQTTYDARFDGEKLALVSDMRFIQHRPGSNPNEILMPPPGCVSHEEFRFDGKQPSYVQFGQRTATVGDANGPVGRAVRSAWRRASVSTYGVVEPDKYESVGVCPSTMSYVGKAMLEDVECLVLERAFKCGEISNRVRFWVCPSRGYTTLRIRTWSAEANGAEELVAQTDTKVRRSATGLWVPSESTRLEYGLDSKGKRCEVSRSTASFDSGYQYNIPVDSAAFGAKADSGSTARAY